MNYTANFLRDGLATYARSALPFVSDTHRVVEDMLNSTDESTDDNIISCAVTRVLELDELYETMTLNHIARRASKSQGVALLTLFSKGFSKPRLSHLDPSGTVNVAEKEKRASVFVDRLKLLVRREETHGHLPICWGLLTATLGLSAERSQYLHLFLQARGLLSSSVRLNTIGPYAAQQLLLHVIRPLVETEISRCKDLTSGIALSRAREQEVANEDVVHGPAMTWPLGEILAARHDLQHSRIFNS
ncbi:hypothetical protein C8Q80DRAFT_546862 [Daedaleopsis nitida]|nr:hypothetical protein C8Q80DRAFT_546862 [Daedaleopsis nitida]